MIDLTEMIQNPECWASKIVCRYDEAPIVKRHLRDGEDKVLVAEVKRTRTHITALEAENARLREINANLMGDDEDAPRYTTKRLKQEIAKALASRTEASAAVKANVSEILLPLEDIHSDAGQCEWADVANAIDEVRHRILSALSPAPQEAEAVDLPYICDACTRHGGGTCRCHPPAPAVTEAMLTRSPAIEALTPTHGEWVACVSTQDTYDLMKRKVRTALQAAHEVKP